MSRKTHGAFGLLCAALLLAVPALADPAAAGANAPAGEFIGPPPAPTAAAPAPVAAAPVFAPRAAASAPANANWLRQSARPAQKLETKAPMSPLRVGGMLALVAVLGGVAYYARRRRQTTPAPVASEKLKVLGSTRVGPKAFAVVAQVAGKRLLLGVTDQSVNTLAWLDAEAADEDDRTEVRPSRPAPIRRDTDEAPQGPSGFLRVLRSAVGSGDVRSVAADEIAKRTRDEVTLSHRSKGEPEELEGQVKGLARRRRDQS